MELNRELIEEFFIVEYALQDEYYDEFVDFKVESNFVIIKFINMFGECHEISILENEILEFLKSN